MVVGAQENIFRKLLKTQGVQKTLFQFCIGSFSVKFNKMFFFPVKAHWIKILFRGATLCFSKYLSFQRPPTYITSHTHNLPNRAQPDWAYEFPAQTGPETQICRTGPAEPD